MPIKADKSLRAYYNEIDPYAAQWLRNLMAEGWITKGDVDERSIEDVRPDDLAGYDRLHFFAGVAVWDYALNQAGWGRREVWTGSCPCQPFSSAGKGAGFADERHLWPHFHWLIEQCRPGICLGEQVASKDGLAWIDTVQADLEGAGYTSGALDTCAAGFGAPHIRQRIYWVALRGVRRPEPVGSVAASSGACGLADVHGTGCSAGSEGSSTVGHGQAIEPDSGAGWMADAEGKRRQDGAEIDRGRSPIYGATAKVERTGDRGTPSGSRATSPTNGFWADADWLGCRDGKWRPVEPGTFPLVDGASARVGRLRGYGNAINAQQATAFIEAVMEILE